MNKLTEGEVLYIEHALRTLLYQQAHSKTEGYSVDEIKNNSKKHQELIEKISLLNTK